MTRPRDEFGDPIRPEDVLDREELADYYRSQRNKGRVRYGPGSAKSAEERRDEIEWGGEDLP